MRSGQAILPDVANQTDKQQLLESLTKATRPPLVNELLDESGDFVHYLNGYVGTVIHFLMSVLRLLKMFNQHISCYFDGCQCLYNDLHHNCYIYHL